MSDDATRTQAVGNQLQIQQLFKVMCDNDASDLHICSGTSPAIRISGEVVRIKVGVLKPEDTKRLVYQILTEEQRNTFEKELDLDFSFGTKGLARFRANVYYSTGSVSAVFRKIPTEIPECHSLGMPQILLDMCNNRLIYCAKIAP